MCNVYMKNILNYLETFRLIIQTEKNIKVRERLNQKLFFLESFRILDWNENLQKKFINFIEYVDHFDDELFSKVDLMITVGTMFDKIPMMHFDQYSNHALLLCSSVMKNISYDDFDLYGSFLCNKDIVFFVMNMQPDLNDQLRIYNESIDGCVTGLYDFMISLDLRKIMSDEKLYCGIILIMKQIVEKYVSYMNLSEGEIQNSLRKKCVYGIK